MEAERLLFPGKDYVNWIYKDLYEVDQPFIGACVGLLDVNLGNRYFFNFTLQISDDINRNDIPRMPWHDCSVGVTGQVAGDFARHFIQRWNAHRVRFRHLFLKQITQI